MKAITTKAEFEIEQRKFVNDFVAVWNKVMNLDRFDLPG